MAGFAAHRTPVFPVWFRAQSGRPHTDAAVSSSLCSSLYGRCSAETQFNSPLNPYRLTGKEHSIELPNVGAGVLCMHLLSMSKRHASLKDVIGSDTDVRITGWILEDGHVMVIQSWNLLDHAPHADFLPFG
jgi:hypothetical protein